MAVGGSLASIFSSVKESITNTANDSLSFLGQKIEDRLPDAIASGNKTYHQYPHNLVDTVTNSHAFVIQPYTGRLTNIGQENTRLIENALPPVFIKIPEFGEEEYSHKYSAEDLLYNKREIAGGGGRSGGLTPDNNVGIIGQGTLRETLRHLQSLPGGTSVRASLHGGARAATELLYDSPNLRNFVFKWHISPKNQLDEEAFIDLFRYLKSQSAPTYDGITQTYPSIFDLRYVSFNKDVGGFVQSGAMNSVYIFTKCALVSISQNFSLNQGSLQSSGLPKDIEMTLVFQELMPLDRETIETQEILQIPTLEALNATTPGNNPVVNVEILDQVAIDPATGAEIPVNGGG